MLIFCLINYTIIFIAPLTCKKIGIFINLGGESIFSLKKMKYYNVSLILNNYKGSLHNQL